MILFVPELPDGHPAFEGLREFSGEAVKRGEVLRQFVAAAFSRA